MPRTKAHPDYRTASILDHGKYFSVFDAEGTLVFQVWARNPETELSRDIARRRANALRETLDAEGDTPTDTRFRSIAALDDLVQGRTVKQAAE